MSDDELVKDVNPGKPMAEKTPKPRAKIRNSAAINLFVASVGGGLVWWFGGPYAGEFARWTYETSYHAIYGQPGWVDWALVYLPSRGHVTHFAYDVGEVALAGVATPVFYALSSKIQSAVRHFHQRMWDGAEAIVVDENELMDELAPQCNHATPQSDLLSRHTEARDMLREPIQNFDPADTLQPAFLNMKLDDTSEGRAMLVSSAPADLGARTPETEPKKPKGIN